MLQAHKALQVAAPLPGKGSPTKERRFTLPSRPGWRGCPSPFIPPAGTALHPSKILTSAPMLHGASLPGPCRRLLPQDPGVHRSVHQEAQESARPLLGRTEPPPRGSSCRPPSSHASLGGPALSPPGLQARPHTRRRRSWAATEVPRSRRDKVPPPEREVELHLPDPSARHGASPDAASHRPPRHVRQATLRGRGSVSRDGAGWRPTWGVWSVGKPFPRHPRATPSSRPTLGSGPRRCLRPPKPLLDWDRHFP